MFAGLFFAWWIKFQMVPIQGAYLSLPTWSPQFTASKDKMSNHRPAQMLLPPTFRMDFRGTQFWGVIRITGGSATTNVSVRASADLLLLTTSHLKVWRSFPHSTSGGDCRRRRIKGSPLLRRRIVICWRPNKAAGHRHTLLTFVYTQYISITFRRLEHLPRIPSRVWHDENRPAGQRRAEKTKKRVTLFSFFN